MKLPGWLTGTKTSVLPEPSTHRDRTAQEVVEYFNLGGHVRLVAMPDNSDTEVPVVDGRWPLITDARLVEDVASGARLGLEAGGGPLVTIEVEDKKGWAFYLEPGDVITVAPA